MCMLGMRVMCLRIYMHVLYARMQVNVCMYVMYVGYACTNYCLVLSRLSVIYTYVCYACTLWIYCVCMLCMLRMCM